MDFLNTICGIAGCNKINITVFFEIATLSTQQSKHLHPTGFRGYRRMHNIFRVSAG